MHFNTRFVQYQFVSVLGKLINNLSGPCCLDPYTVYSNHISFYHTTVSGILLGCWVMQCCWFCGCLYIYLISFMNEADLWGVGKRAIYDANTLPVQIWDSHYLTAVKYKFQGVFLKKIELHSFVCYHFLRILQQNECLNFRFRCISVCIHA